MEDAEQVQLTLASSSGAQTTARATLTEDGDDCVLLVAWPDGVEQRFAEPDYYECLRAFRRVLDDQGIKVLCQGARPNVFPSSMARAGGALKAYALTHGEQAFSKDLVNIFDPVVDVSSVGTVADQEAFVDSHFKALVARG